MFSQGETLGELEEDIRDAYRAMTADERESVPEGALLKEVVIEL